MKTTRLWLYTLGLATLIAAPSAMAQMDNLPKNVFDAIAKMGPNLNQSIIKATNALMRPLQASDRDLVSIKDIPYGDNPGERLDLYEPHSAERAAPVAIFVHGGGFVGGDKSNEENVPAYLARHGILGININYRLAPKYTWPAASEDVAMAVAWAHSHAASYNGDPARIILVGHSAGAAAVALYVLDPSLRPRTATGVVGAILISGPFRMDPPRGPTDHLYYGNDPSKYSGRVPFTYAADSKLPLMIAMAEYDLVPLATDSLALAAAVCDRDRKCPDFLFLRGHNHISETASVGTADNRLGAGMLDFIGTVAK
jgi:triacylglycerol lipase